MADKLAGTFYVQTAAEKGAPGVAGQIVRQSVWAAGAVYHNDNETVSSPRYLDVVLVYATNGVISRYMCKQTHTAAEANKPSASSSHWTLLSGDFPLYTPLLIADNGDIKFFQTTRILIQKPDGTITAGISGHGEGETGVRFWAGGADPASASFKMLENGAGHVANGNLSWDKFGYIYQRSRSRIIWRMVRDEMIISGIFTDFQIDLLKGTFLDLAASSSNSALLPDPSTMQNAIIDTRFMITTRSSYPIQIKCPGKLYIIKNGNKTYPTGIYQNGGVDFEIKYGTITSIYNSLSGTWEWCAEGFS